MTQKKESNSSKSCSSSVHNFFTGLGGLGNLLLGGAACIALSETDTVLEKIFNIQKMAENTHKKAEKIDEAVGELKTGNDQIHRATHEIKDSEETLKDTVQKINVLVEKIKQDTSAIIKDYLRKNGMPEKIKQNSHNKKELSNVLKTIPSEHQGLKEGDPYLPTEKFSALKQELQEKAPKASLEEITNILKENLKIWTK